MGLEQIAYCRGWERMIKAANEWRWILDPEKTYSIYILCLSVWVSVCLFVSNKRSGPNFVWDFTWPQGRFINDQNFQKLASSKIWFTFKFWKYTNLFYKTPQTFLFVFVLQCSQLKYKMGAKCPESQKTENKIAMLFVCMRCT